jgi:hypothetical protein
MRNVISYGAVLQDDDFDTDKTVGFLGGAVSKALPSVLASIDASLGPRFPLVAWLLRLLGLSTGPEFESEAEVLSLYDRDQLSKLAEKGVGGFTPESMVVTDAGEGVVAQAACGHFAFTSSTESSSPMPVSQAVPWTMRFYFCPSYCHSKSLLAGLRCNLDNWHAHNNVGNTSNLVRHVLSRALCCQRLIQGPRACNIIMSRGAMISKGDSATINIGVISLFTLASHWRDTRALLSHLVMLQAGAATLGAGCSVTLEWAVESSTAAPAPSRGAQQQTRRQTLLSTILRHPRGIRD